MRENLTIWFIPEAIEKYLAPKEGKKGRPKIYSKEAILCALMLHCFNLTRIVLIQS
jgi:hypothetical protein